MRLPAMMAEAGRWPSALGQADIAGTLKSWFAEEAPPAARADRLSERELYRRGQAIAAEMRNRLVSRLMGSFVGTAGPAAAASRWSCSVALAGCRAHHRSLAF